MCQTKGALNDVIMSKVLTRGDYPALSRSTLNAVTCILMKVRQRDIDTHRGKNNVKKEKKRLKDAGLEDWIDVATNQGILAITKN